MTKSELQIVISAETARLQAGLRSAQAQLQRFGDQAKKATSQQNWLSGAVQLGTALKGTEMIIRSSLTAAKLLTGEIKNWKEAATEAVRMIPMVGTAIADAYEWASGKDLKEDLKKRQDQEAKNKTRLDAQRRKLSEDFEKDARRRREDTQIGGMSGIQKELALLARRRRDDLEALRERAQSVSANPDTIRAQKNLEAQIKADYWTDYARTWKAKLTEGAKAVREGLENIRKAAREKIGEIRSDLGKMFDEQFARQQELKDVQSEVVQARLQARKKDQEAERELIRRTFEARIAEARRAGKMELAAELATLRDLKMAAVQRDKLKRSGTVKEFAAGTMFAGRPRRAVAESPAPAVDEQPAAGTSPAAARRAAAQAAVAARRAAVQAAVEARRAAVAMVNQQAALRRQQFAGIGNRRAVPQENANPFSPLSSTNPVLETLKQIAKNTGGPKVGIAG